MTMEDTTWEQRLRALTHVLTSPTVTPTLHSQFFIATQIPCYLNWDYPPILCSNPSLLKRWGFSFFLKRILTMGIPQTSWRSKCPFQQPPPLILAEGVEEARWGKEERKAYVRKRLARKTLGRNVNPLIPIAIPNLLLLSLMIWNPFRSQDDWQQFLLLCVGIDHSFNVHLIMKRVSNLSPQFCISSFSLSIIKTLHIFIKVYNLST